MNKCLALSTHGKEPTQTLATSTDLPEHYLRNGSIICSHQTRHLNIEIIQQGMAWHKPAPKANAGYPQTEKAKK